MATKKPLVNSSGEVTEISSSDQVPYQNIASGTPSNGHVPVYQDGELVYQTVGGGGGGLEVTGTPTDGQVPVYIDADAETQWKDLLVNEPGLIPGHIVWSGPFPIGGTADCLALAGNQTSVLYGWRFESTGGTVAGIVFAESTCDNETGNLATSLSVTNSDATFQTLLNTGEYRTGSASSPLVLTLTGLTIGQRYSVQLFVADSRSSVSNRRQRYEDVYGNVSSDCRHGDLTYVYGDFEAAATTQEIRVRWVSGYTDAALINLAVVRNGTYGTYDTTVYKVPLDNLTSGVLSSKAKLVFPDNQVPGTTNREILGTSAGLRIGLPSGLNLQGYIGTIRHLLVDQNIAIGYNCMVNSSAPTGKSVAIGYGAAASATSMAEAVCIGYNAGTAATSAGPVCIGPYAGDSITTGSGNLCVGRIAGAGITTGTDNTMVGKEAGDAVTTGSYNTAIGSGALPNVTGSYYIGIGNNTGGNGSSVTAYPICIGHGAGAALTTGGVNAIGKDCLRLSTTSIGTAANGFESFYSLTTGNDCTGMGHRTGRYTTGGGNTFVGHRAGYNVTTATNTVGIGFGALDGSGAKSGSGTIAIGFDAGKGLSTGIYNVLVGYRAGQNITTGSNNIAMGQNALTSTGAGPCGDNNVALGQETLREVTTGHSNIAIGLQCGRGITSGAANVHIGYLSGYDSTTGNYSVGIGRSALEKATTASSNVALGRHQLGNLTTGASNIAIGEWTSVGGVITGAYNILMGYNAGDAITSANYSVGIGYESLTNLTTCANMIAIGYRTLSNVSTNSVSSIAIGSDALRVADSTSGSNIAIGRSALTALTSASDNTVVGYLAGLAVTTGAGNTLIGKNAGTSATTGEYNTYVGHAAGALTSTGGNNVALGRSALYSLTGAYGVIAIGYEAGNQHTGGFSVFIGNQAGKGQQTGTDHIAIGSSAMLGIGSTGTGGIAIGTNTLRNVSSGNYNTAIGFEAGYTASTASNNILIGYYAGRAITTSGNNLLLGSNAGDSITTGSFNLGLGRNALTALTSGADNVCLGDGAGSTLTTGSNNILIGKDIAPGSITGSNQINIGNALVKTTADDIAIKTTLAERKLNSSGFAADTLKGSIEYGQSASIPGPVDFVSVFPVSLPDRDDYPVGVIEIFATSSGVKKYARFIWEDGTVTLDYGDTAVFATTDTASKICVVTGTLGALALYNNLAGSTDIYYRVTCSN